MVVQQQAQSYLSRLISPETLATIGLIGVGIWGIIVAIGTLNHMRESSERQLRAYLFTVTTDMLEGGMLNPPSLVHAMVPFVHITIKNSGQTPAYDVISWLQIAVTMPENENTLFMRLPMPRVSANNIGPDVVIIKSLWFDRPLTAPEIADVVTGARGIYVYGRIEYTDAFTVKRFTNFRLRYNGVFPPLPNSTFNFCESGNDAN